MNVTTYKGIALFFLFLVTLSLNAQTFCEDLIGFNCDDCPKYSVTLNPDLTLDCGNSINAILLIDESNSIGNSNAQQDVQDGVSAFLQALECSGINVAIIEFGSAANYIVQAYTPVSEVLDGMDNYFNGIPFNGQTYNPNQGIFGATNWQAGFLRANALPTADLLIMLTDGVPTAYTPEATLPGDSFDFCLAGNSTEEAELYNAVQVANTIKNQGTHIFILGVGAVNADLLVDISGNDQFSEGESIATADYFIDDGCGSLAECFSDLATSFCPIVDNINGSTICEGDSNGFISISMTENATAPFYITVNDNEPIVTNSYNELITGLEVGTYNIQVEGTGSCFGVANFVVDVLAYPLPDLSIENTSICQGIKSSVDLLNLVTSSGNITFYNSLQDAENDNNPLVSSIVNPAEETTYYIRCESLENNCFITDSVTIFVSLPPTCSVDDALINCYSENGATTLTVTTNALNVTYNWTAIGGNIVSGENTANPVVNQAGTYAVSITDLDTGCVSNCSAIVTENIVIPDVSISPVDVLCSGHDPIQIAAFPIGGEFSGDAVTSSGVFEALNAGVYTITYEYTNPENGCEGTASVDIEVIDCCSDETAFAYDDELATCFPGVRRDTNQTIFNQNSGTLSRSRRWGWSLGALDFNTEYTFQLIAGAGRCNLDNGELVGEVTISYNENGDMIVNYSLNEEEESMYYQLGDVHIYIGCNQFPERLAPGQMPYHSSADDELSVSLLIPVEDLEDLDCDEFYFIAHAEVNVCSTEMQINRGVVTSKDNYLDNIQTTVLVYPVPYKDYVTIQLLIAYDTDVIIELLDVKGCLIQQIQEKGITRNTDTKIKLDLTNYTNQLFFVRISTGKETIVKKIVPLN